MSNRKFKLFLTGPFLTLLFIATQFTQAPSAPRRDETQESKSPAAHAARNQEPVGARGEAKERVDGLTESSVKVGTILPAGGALAEMGSAMRDVLAAFFSELNEQGGVHGRRVMLQTTEGGERAALTAANARRLAEEGQVFALVGGLSAGADKELVDLAQELQLPFVGPSTLLPQTGPGANRFVFYLLPGVAEQTRALVNFYARRRPRPSAKLAIVHNAQQLAAASAAAAEEQCRKADCGPVQTAVYERGKFDAPALVRTLKGADAVLFLGDAGDEVSFLAAADAAGWHPDILMPGAASGRDLAKTLTASFGGKLFLAFPSVPTDVTVEGAAELRALSEKYKFALRHVASQQSALAAAKVFVEGLKRAGKGLSREKFVAALEGLRNFETGLTPRITFGPQRRVGAAGANIIGIDTERKKFVQTGGWVDAY